MGQFSECYQANGTSTILTHFCADDPAFNRLSSSSLLSVAEENMSTLSFAGANLTGRQIFDLASLEYAKAFDSDIII